MAASAYEEVRRKRLEENKKKMADLNIHKLAQSLHTPKPAPVLKPRVPKHPIDPNSVRRSSRVANLPPVNYIYKRSAASVPAEDEACLPRRLRRTDMISELPDGILGRILSFLTMREARCMSVLSKRWRHVWTYIPALKCDILHELKLGEESMEHVGVEYLHYVDEVVSLSKASELDEFRVKFDINCLGSTCRESINNWFIFAIEKKTKRLEIDLSFGSGGSGLVCHTFSGRHTLSSLSMCNSLSSLELGCVNVTGDILENFLRKCLALEYLSVKYSEFLVELSVDSLSLKSLRVYRCNKMEKLEFSAPNLVSFCYIGRKINVEVKSMPKLVEVSFGDEYAGDLDSSFSDLLNYHSQIEVLTLHPCGKIKDIKISTEGPIFTKLEKLDLEVLPCWDDDINSLASLIKACPCLHHLKLEFKTNSNHFGHREGLKKQESYPHYELKTLEIVGFVGYGIDMEVAGLLIESAVSLEKITIDTPEMPGKHRARTWAGRLRRKLKPGTTLEIL